MVILGLVCDVGLIVGEEIIFYQNIANIYVQWIYTKLFEYTYKTSTTKVV